LQDPSREDERALVPILLPILGVVEIFGSVVGLFQLLTLGK